MPDLFVVYDCMTNDPCDAVLVLAASAPDAVVAAAPRVPPVAYSYSGGPQPATRKFAVHRAEKIGARVASDGMALIATRDRQLALLEDALGRAWSHETSSDPGRWTERNAAAGQCAVTALVVQDEFGGDLLRAMVGDVSHYWNRLPDGVEVDLTRQQFPGDAEYGATVVRDREYVLSFPDTLKRYCLLRDELGGPDSAPDA